MSLASLVGIGVIVSLSRGAWLSAVLAVPVLAVLLKKDLRWYRTAAILLLTLGIGSIGLSQVAKQIRLRLDRLGLDDLTLDERWSHWKDGIATATQHFPSGSGIGTYGYATLLEQSQPRLGWFREAHNQYLEIATESGVVGIISLAGLLIWAVRVSWRLRSRPIRRSGQREHQSWGLFAVAVLIFAAAQSLVDFVIAIPANMMLYACFIGILARVEHQAELNRTTTAPVTSPKPRLLNTISNLETAENKPKSGSSPRAKLLGHALVCTLVVSGLAFAILTTRDQYQGDIAIEQTPISDLVDQPTPSLVSERIAILDSAIAVQSDRAVLYRHRAMWNFARYRGDVIAAAKVSGESVPWDSTQPEALFQILTSLPDASRQATVEAMTAPELAGPLEDTLNDLANAITSNPLFVQAQLAGSYLAVLVNMEPQSWIVHSVALSKSDPEKLYVTGLLASNFAMNDLANNQWRDCLAISPKFAQTILPLALQKFSPLEVAHQIVPASRPEMQITLIQTVLTTTDQQSPWRNQDMKQLAGEIVEELTNAGPMLAEGHRQAIAASVLDLVGESKVATDHWLAAVDADPTNSTYRLKAAEGLRAGGNFNEALRHVVLGSTLAPSDTRFQYLAQRIRAGIKQAILSSQ